MYLRTTQRRNRDGSTVRYLQLAHNHWDATSGRSSVRVLYHFGREDQLDRDAVRRLIGSLSRALDPSEALSLQAPQLHFLDSRPMGGAWLLDQLWRRLGLDQILTRLLRSRRLDPRAERALFAMVCNRALEPMSKLGCAAWVTEKVVIPGLPKLDDDRCYRAMDWLLEIEPELAQQVYWAVADLLNLEVDLLFFDTTSTYFQIWEADPPTAYANKGFRTHGHSKDHRSELPQVVIGMAVTREGIPVRVWTWPGNTSDNALIRQVKEDLRAWKLSRVVWVADTGFNSAENRRYLQRAGGHYILGEKLRGGSKEAQAVLASPLGRYQHVAGNLQVKEVVLADGTMRDRFMLCFNPEAAERDRNFRAELIEQLEAAIAGSDQMPRDERLQLAQRLRSSQPELARFLTITGSGLLRVGKGLLADAAKLDGKFLLRTSDPTLSAEDVALGYKQLWQVERAWRDMKTTLDLRPVYHRKEERIRAHVLLCWLSLLLIRLAENGTNQTWHQLRRELEKMHLGRFNGRAGLVEQRTELTTSQQATFRALGVDEPPRFFHLEPADPAEIA
jgi:Transposase DDE domain